MIPTKEEYLKAKEITNVYERHEEAEFLIRLELFRKDLEQYFKTHTVSGYCIREFELRDEFNNRYYDIIPTDPPIEEDYEGENNADIDEIGKRHGIKAKFVYWMYHK